MSTSHIRNHKYDAHHAAVTGIQRTLTNLDMELRALARRQDLYPAEKERKGKELRQAAEQQIRGHREALGKAVTADREAARWTEPAPSGEELRRRAYYAQQAQAELAAGDARDLLARVKSVVEAGDDERAREYVRAARGRVDPGELARLESRVEPREAKMHRSFAAAVETVEGNLSWFDRWTAEHLAKAGRVSEAEKRGEPGGEHFTTRQLSLWFDRARHEAAVAFERRAAEQDGKEPAAWARSGDGRDPSQERGQGGRDGGQDGSGASGGGDGAGDGSGAGDGGSGAGGGEAA